MITEQNRLTGWGRRACAALALGLAVGALSACDSLLDVDLPAELTDQALEDPTGAETQMVTAVTHFEDAYDFHLDEVFGREDGGEVFMCGPSCGHYQYQITHGEFDGFSKGRRFANGLHAKLVDEWTVTQVPERAELLAISSIYEGAALHWMGDVLCEATVDGGPLISPDGLWSMAEGLYATALSEISAAGDFAMPSRIATSATTMTYGLRAQVRWASGDMAGAMADAQLVPDGFVGLGDPGIEPAELQRLEPEQRRLPRSVRPDRLVARRHESGDGPAVAGRAPLHGLHLPGDPARRAGR